MESLDKAPPLDPYFTFRQYPHRYAFIHSALGNSFLENSERCIPSCIIHDPAIRDELTGVFKRRELIRVAERERCHAEQNGSRFSPCLIDVEHFKSINDACAHAAGDEVLKRIALKIREDIRKADCFGRCGGEEFLLLLLIQCDATTAISVRQPMQASNGRPQVQRCIAG